MKFDHDNQIWQLLYYYLTPSACYLLYLTIFNLPDKKKSFLYFLRSKFTGKTCCDIAHQIFGSETMDQAPLQKKIPDHQHFLK